MKDEEFDKKFKSIIKEDIEIPEKINQLFSKFEEEVIEMKEREENLNQLNKRSKRVKRISILAWLIGIFGACGVVYATVIPQEWKTNITSFINSYFGVHYDESTYNGGVQDKTLENIIEADISNPEKYSQLLDADVYGIGDSNAGTLIETNYNQYNFNKQYDETEERKLEKYSSPVIIKTAKINYSCLEKLDQESIVLDNDGNVISKKEYTIEESTKFQFNEFSKNWAQYYYGNDGKTYKDLYFKITGMTIMNGNNSTDTSYNEYARAKKIKVTINNEKEEIINLLDTPNAQFVDLDYVQNDISKPVTIKVEVLETFKGDIRKDTYIADIQFGISSNIPQGR